MKNKGFTLAELLAVIIVLAIILAIAVPSIYGIINSATKEAFQSDAKMLLQAVEYKKLETDTFDINNFNIDYIRDVLKLSTENYSEIVAEPEGNAIKITVVGQNKWEGLTAYGTIKNMTVVNTADYDVTPPIIMLTGPATITIEVGSTYVDQGATATDEKDGDITSFIQVTNNVNTGIAGAYTVRYDVSDKAGNSAIQVVRDVTVVDSAAPVITMLGTSPINIYVNDVYTDAGATAVDNVDGNITDDIVITSTVNTSFAGSYSVTYDVTDSVGNSAVPVIRTINVIDNIAPTVAFGTNGNSTYAKTRSTTVNVADANSNVNSTSLKYLWNTSTTAPLEASFTTSFTNGGVIGSPAGVTGGYYLWILAKDNSGNITIQKTNVFNLDNTVPIITVLGTNPTYINLGTTYTDSGATASDAIDGNITSSIITTGTVNPNVIGAYAITYTVTDSSLNSTIQTRTVNVIGATMGVLSAGSLNNRSMGLYNNQYYIYWPSGNDIGYAILNSQTQVVSTGSFPINGATYTSGSVSVSTNIGSPIWTARRDNHYYGGHMSMGTYIGWHNAGYMDIATLSGYTIVFHTGRSDANYARVYNVNLSRELSTYYSNGGWGESWRVFPYSSTSALAFGNSTGRIKITVDAAGNFSSVNNPAEIPSDISNSQGNFGRMQMDENKKFHYMTSGTNFKNQLGNLTLNVGAGTINDYALNIHPNLAVTATLVDNTKFVYCIINRNNNQLIKQATYTLDGTYNFIVPIQSIGNSNESVFLVQNGSASLTRAIRIGLPS